MNKVCHIYKWGIEVLLSCTTMPDMHIILFRLPSNTEIVEANVDFVNVLHAWTCAGIHRMLQLQSNYEHNHFWQVIRAVFNINILVINQ